MILFVAQLVAGAAVAALIAWAALSWRKPLAPNYRGRMIPAVLGIPVVVSLCWAVPVVLVAIALGEERPNLRPYGAILLGIILVFGAGLYDDLQPVRTRGLVHQIRLAFTGRLTSGVVKLIVILAASVLVAFSVTGPGSPPAWLAVPVLAGSANGTPVRAGESSAERRFRPETSAVERSAGEWSEVVHPADRGR